MIRVKARIKLYINGRKTPFMTGYRPLFTFVGEVKTSGKITLKGRSDFPPGDEDIVEIAFLHREFLGENFGMGSRFTFGEGREPFGEGVVKELL